MSEEVKKLNVTRATKAEIIAYTKKLENALGKALERANILEKVNQEQEDQREEHILQEMIGMSRDVSGLVERTETLITLVANNQDNVMDRLGLTLSNVVKMQKEIPTKPSMFERFVGSVVVGAIFLAAVVVLVQAGVEWM